MGAEHDTDEGPVGRSGKTSFLLSGHDRLEDQQAFIFAVGLSGPIQDVAPQPSRESLLAGSVTHQKSDKTTFVVRQESPVRLVEDADGETLLVAGTLGTVPEQTRQWAEAGVDRLIVYVSPPFTEGIRRLADVARASSAND